MNSEKGSKNIQIAPSILAADFGHLADEVKKLEDGGADAVHIDIMDGHFVPNLTMGPKICGTIKKNTNLFLDVHMMVYNPFDYVERFVEQGADRITFHLEATEDVEDTLSYIRRCNVQAGLAFCPETSVTFIPKYLDKCDMVLIMTVNPGFGGQSFMPETLEKIEFVRSTCDKINIRKGGVTPQEGEILPPFDIQVDGGIEPETAKLCREKGANVFVAGTYVFEAESVKKGIDNLREAVNGIK